MLANNQTEQWKPVVGYEGVYYVSSHGRVRRDRRRADGHVTQRMLAKSLDGGGYVKVNLYRHSRPLTITVHRLVASAFLASDPLRHHVNHKNGIKTDNRVENLEWVTHAENVCHAVLHGLTNAGDRHPSRRHPEIILRGEHHGRATLTDSAIRLIRADSRTLREIAADHGVTLGQISHIKRRRRWQHIA